MSDVLNETLDGSSHQKRGGRSDQVFVRVILNFFKTKPKDNDKDIKGDN